jgi:hypothetical protein
MSTVPDELRIRLTRRVTAWTLLAIAGGIGIAIYLRGGQNDPKVQTAIVPGLLTVLDEPHVVFVKGNSQGTVTSARYVAGHVAVGNR